MKLTQKIFPKFIEQLKLGNKYIFGKKKAKFY